ncbi:uncharacterized protein LOC132553669 [Ylistrum balloti]|uniref:uncharacterized protein LOC132553669 n=1 Tax=Ylistrum balloti TaxID=509963 RepID=UPI002905D2D7|nr:uncharacterized protein LOC132553669 [Ylistrum balloti]
MQPQHITNQYFAYQPQVHLHIIQPNRVQNVSQVQARNQEVYRQHRGDISRKFKAIGVVYFSLGVLLMFIGALAIYYGAPDIPYVIPVHIVTAIMLCAAGICSYLAGRRTQTEDSVSPQIKCLVSTIFCLTIGMISFCFVTAGINGAMGIAFCFGIEYSRSGSVQNVNDMCTKNKDQNVIMSSVIIGVSVLGGLFCILVTCFFCVFRRIFGLQKERPRRQILF